MVRIGVRRMARRLGPERMQRLRHVRQPRHFRPRLAAGLLAACTVAAAMTGSVQVARAAGTTLFNQPFHNNTVDGPAGSVVVPAAPTGTNFACLTAAGNSSANPLASCKTNTDAQGSGKLRGATESQPVTITQTLPAGVVPLAAYGTGWTCGAPSGQQISCTSTGSTFTSGTITVNGVVTSSTMTQSTIQTTTKALVSASDGSPASSTSAPAGTVSAAPTVTSLNPTNGPAGGANSVVITGTNFSAATAVEIGTSAEFTGGTPTTLVPCAGGAASGCFTVVSGTSISIPSMPAHAAAAVTVKVVNLGVGGSGSYTYNPGPALLFPPPPSGETGVAYSNQLTVTGGTSPFTWSVSAGTLPPGVTLGASAGLLSGTPTAPGTFNFTVKVTDKSGLSDTKPVALSVAVPATSVAGTYTATITHSVT